jgi:hypothetical protein
MFQSHIPATPSSSLDYSTSSFSFKELLGKDGLDLPVNFMVNWLIWNQSSFVIAAEFCLCWIPTGSYRAST